MNNLPKPKITVENTHPVRVKSTKQLRTRIITHPARSLDKTYRS